MARSKSRNPLWISTMFHLREVIFVTVARISLSNTLTVTIQSIYNSYHIFFVAATFRKNVEHMLDFI